MSSIPIADIRIGERHRKNLGDLSTLAESIKSEGLLQEIGISPDRVLVFGERRLRACRDLLGWSEISARVVNVSSIAAGEYAENEIRKDFTPSERVAILRTIGRKPLGDQGRSQNIATADTASRMAGLGNRETARQAEIVVDQGIPELISKMDSGGVAIGTAAKIAALDANQQAEVLDRAADDGSLRQALESVTGVEHETPVQHQSSAPVILPPRRVGLADLQTAWRQADDHARRQFLRWLYETEPRMYEEIQADQ